MAAMQKWVAKQRGNLEGITPAELDTFAKWVNERADAARGTAALETSAPEVSSGY
jgi:hypothetical protein